MQSTKDLDGKHYRDNNRLKPVGEIKMICSGYLTVLPLSHLSKQAICISEKVEALRGYFHFHRSLKLDNIFYLWLT